MKIIVILSLNTEQKLNWISTAIRQNQEQNICKESCREQRTGLLPSED